jgi:hypothetical protein
MTREEEIKLIDELIQSGEGQTVDFKKSDILSDRIKLAKLMVAFANSNGGRILIGICDNGTKEGMKATPEHERHIMNIGRDNCAPPLVPDFSVINTPEGDIYIVKILRFQKFAHAAKTKEGKVYFIRAGSTVREADPSEIALFFEPTTEEKRPVLKLLLLDTDENATEVITAQPIIIKKRYVKKESKPPIVHLAELVAPTQLVPITIEVSNIGEIPAEGINIFLEFPEECELVEEHDAVGGILPKPTTSRGLFVDDENRSVARAWIKILGNDLTIRKFNKIYVRFPEKKQDYLIKGRIIQHRFPPTYYEFKIAIDPQIKDVIEYVYEERT